MSIENESAIKALQEAAKEVGFFLLRHKVEFEDSTIDPISLEFAAHALDNTELSDVESRELLSSIKSVGIVNPIIINDKDEVLDGKNRVKFALELGLPEVPVRKIKGLSSGLELILSFQLNYARRNAKAEDKHKAYNNFKRRLLETLENKSRDEAIKILPELEKFWPEVRDGKRPPKKSEVTKTVDIVSGIPGSTLRRYNLADKAKEEMQETLPEQFPKGKKISDSAAMLFIKRKKAKKYNKPSAEAIAGLCVECDRLATCTWVKEMWKRSCYSNQDACKHLQPTPDEDIQTKTFLQPSFALAEYYRSVKRIPVKDKAWRKVMLGRSISRCRDILELCDFDLEVAKYCISYLAKQFESKKLSWTLETIIEHAPEAIMAWKKQQGV